MTDSSGSHRTVHSTSTRSTSIKTCTRHAHLIELSFSIVIFSLAFSALQEVLVVPAASAQHIRAHYSTTKRTRLRETQFEVRAARGASAAAAAAATRHDTRCTAQCRSRVAREPLPSRFAALRATASQDTTRLSFAPSHLLRLLYVYPSCATSFRALSPLLFSVCLVRCLFYSVLRLDMLTSLTRVSSSRSDASGSESECPSTFHSASVPATSTCYFECCETRGMPSQRYC